MCLQCTTEAVVVARDVLPGTILMRAVVDSPEWPAGWYGLVESNDPFMVFPTLLADPKFPDDVLNAEAPETVAAENAYSEAVTAMRDNLNLSFTTAGEVFQDCIQRGYDRKVHGDVEYWLLDHLARKAKDVVASEPLPGFSLIRAGADHPDLPNGWYGLIDHSGIAFAFPTLLLMPKASIGSFESAAKAAWKEYSAAVDAFYKQEDDTAFQTRLESGDVRELCVQAGYDSAEYGVIEFWLLDHLARKVSQQAAQ